MKQVNDNTMVARYRNKADRILSELLAVGANVNASDPAAIRRGQERLNHLREQALTAIEELEVKQGALSRTEFVIRVAAYKGAVRAVLACGADALVEEIERVAGTDGFGDAEAIEAKSPMLCVAQGVTLAQFIESDSAASALAQFGEGSQP